VPAAVEPPSTSAQAMRPDRALVRLWVGVLLPPVGWMADFMSRYFAIRFANLHDQRWPMAVSTAASLLLVLLGAGLCWQARRQAKASDTRRTLASWGLGLAAFFLLLILAQAYPALVLRAREIT
jgi:hypothetical protein